MADNTLLLIHGDQAVDASQNGLPITNNGVTASNSVTKFGKGSLYFNGNANLTMPGNVFSFGTGDFTVECWVRPETISDDSFFFSGSVSNSFFFGKIVSIATGLGVGRAGVAWDNYFSYVLPAGAWSHVALCRKSGTVYFFVNGALIGSAANSNNYTMQGGLAYVGSQGNALYYKGYIEELRVSNVARWTSNFTPPTKQYNVTSGSRTLLDSVGYEITSGNAMVGGAVYMVTQGNDVVDGTVYNILLEPAAPSKCNITIAQAGSAQYLYVTINGVKYYDLATVEVETGTKIVFGGNCMGTSIYVNGAEVQMMYNQFTYEYVVNTDVEIKFLYRSISAIYITTK